MLKLASRICYFTTIRMSSSFILKPAFPSKIMTSFGNDMLEKLKPEVLTLRQELKQAEITRQQEFEQAKVLLDNSNFALFTARLGGEACMERSENQQFQFNFSGDKVNREGFFGFATQTYVLSNLIQEFYATGIVLPFSSFQYCTDEDYLEALLGFAQELSRYAVSRACEGDIQSIQLCKEVLLDLNQKFLEFSFRNGPLRRKYDGLKYAVKQVESILFDLSLASDLPPASSSGESNSSNNGDNDNGDNGVANSPTKKPRLDKINNEKTTTETSTSTASASATSAALVELEELRVRYEAYDLLRENIIKQSRDVQKLSKQAIFALHRGATADAKDKLGKAEDMLKKMLEVVKENPGLRAGSVTSCLEEWAEGMVTMEWVVNNRIMPKSELSMLDATEYIGALSDFTGEVGRFAVNRAAKRDLNGVLEIRQVDVIVSWVLLQLNIAGKYNKKLDAVHTNLKKVEDIVYEVRLLQRGGRLSNLVEPPPPGKEDGEEVL